MRKLLMALALLPLMAAAETETLGDITWSYSISDDKAMVEGVDPCSGSIVIPSVLGGCPVTSIRVAAFYGCTALTSVRIPESVVFIGADAFTDTKLWDDSSDGIVIVSDCIIGVKGKCPDILVVDERIRCIAEEAFNRCSEITKIQVDSANAYYKCANDCLISMRDNVLIRGANKERICIPAGVEKIGFGAFNFCRLLKSVTIPIGVKEIGSHAFQACTLLEDVLLPMGLEMIDEWAFHFCSALKILDVPESVKEMWYEFGGCPTLVLKFHGAPPTFLDKGWIWERLDSPILYNSKYEVEWLTAIEEFGFTNAKPYMTNGEFSPGETVSIATGLIGYTVKGLPSGLKYDKTTGMITGAATKSGEYVVKFTKSGAETEAMTIVVGPVPKITVEMVGVNAQSDTNGCKVTGTKEYLVGTKATLAATVPTGSMFEGWFKDNQPWPDEATHLNKSVTYTMGKEDVALVAKFKKERMSVACTWLLEGVFTAGVSAGAGNGALLDDYMTTESGVKSIAVTGLPAGMTYNATKRTITGFPTKAGTYNVEITVIANSGAVEKQTIPLTVEALPAWAVGNFAGTVYCEDGTHGTASFSATSAGKITGKFLEHGSNWTFTAASYDAKSVTRGERQAYFINAEAVCGKAKRTVDFAVMGLTMDGMVANIGFATGDLGGGETVEMWRNVWAEAEPKAHLATIAGKYTYFLAAGKSEPVALPLSLNGSSALLSGAVKVPWQANRSVTFSTTAFASSNGVEAVFYVAPYKSGATSYPEFFEHFILIPESGEREAGKAHRNPGVLASAVPHEKGGNGTVSVSPAGGQVDAGKTVTLTATAKADSVFVRWQGTQGSRQFVDPNAKLVLTMDGEHDVVAEAVFRLRTSFDTPVVVVDSAAEYALSRISVGVPVTVRPVVRDEENMLPVKWSAQNLPTGLKIDATTGEITGVATAINSKPIVIIATSVADSKKKTTFTLDIGSADGKPAALSETAVGTFTGFVNNGTDNLGTFTFTSSEKGALSAKVVDAAGTVSFSGSGFAWSEKGKYGVELTTKKGETLALTLDSDAGWDKDQLTGTYKTATGLLLNVTSQRNAFSKAWYFVAEGDETTGWAFAFTNDTKAAALTVTLKADGSTAIAGKLPNGVDAKGKAVSLKVSASGYANVGGMYEGAIIADFAPIVTVNKVKRALSIHTNLWFDRSNDHAEGAGGANLAE